MRGEFRDAESNGHLADLAHYIGRAETNFRSRIAYRATRITLNAGSTRLRHSKTPGIYREQHTSRLPEHTASVVSCSWLRNRRSLRRWPYFFHHTHARRHNKEMGKPGPGDRCHSLPLALMVEGIGTPQQVQEWRSTRFIACWLLIQEARRLSWAHITATIPLADRQLLLISAFFPPHVLGFNPAIVPFATASPPKHYVVKKANP